MERALPGEMITLELKNFIIKNRNLGFNSPSLGLLLNSSSYGKAQQSQVMLYSYLLSSDVMQVHIKLQEQLQNPWLSKVCVQINA